MCKCDDCGKYVNSVYADTYEAPGGAWLQLCDNCAKNAGFIPRYIHEGLKGVE